MAEYSNNLQDKKGNAISGATVSVTTYPDGDPVDIYDVDGNLLNPLLTDTNGNYQFFVIDNGRYNITISRNQLVLFFLEGVYLQTIPVDGYVEYSYDTVADMVADTNLAVGDVVRTLGYLAPGDGGGLAYKVVPAGTGTADGGSYIDLAEHQAQGLLGTQIALAAFGADSSGATDSTTAINNAVQYIRDAISTTLTSDGTSLYSIAGNAGQYLCSGELNFTELQSVNLVVDFGGATIVSEAIGGKSIDMLGTNSIALKNAILVSEENMSPEYGLTMGRTDATGVSAGKIKLINFHMDGYFSRCCVYNYAGEINYYEKCRWTNRSSSTNSFVLIEDSKNNEDIQSNFVPVTAPVGTDRSFNEQIYDSLELRHLDEQPCYLVRGNGSKRKFVTCYFRTDNTHAMEFIETDFLSYYELDVHVETETVTDYMLIKNETATGTIDINGLEIVEQLLFTTNSVIKMNDPAGQVAWVVGLKIRIADADSTGNLFDTGSTDSRLLLSGNIEYGAPAANPLDISQARFIGEIYIRENTPIVNTVGSYAVNQRPASSDFYYREHKGTMRIIGTDNTGDTGIENYIEIEGDFNGRGPQIRTGDIDDPASNVNLRIIPQNEGKIQYGTYTVDGTITPTGYIEMVANDGTPLKVAVEV